MKSFFTVVLFMTMMERDLSAEELAMAKELFRQSLRRAAFETKFGIAP